MATENPFDNKNVHFNILDDKTDILDQLTLPESLKKFIRDNIQALKITVTIVVVAVVFGSLYGSYSEKRKIEASDGLYAALTADEQNKINELKQVSEEFSGTNSAVWAKVEIAHSHVKAGQYTEGLVIYKEVRDDISSSNPLYNLLTSAIAQTNETLGDDEAAIKEYNSLVAVKAYASLGYIALARIYENKDQIDKAVEMYENYKGSLIGSSQSDPLTLIVNNKLRIYSAKKTNRL